MHTLEDAFTHDRALVIGIGGGGDVVGTIPTARLLEHHGVETIIGGIAWERDVIDPTPGPRPFADVEGIERISSHVAFASEKTRTTDGVEFAETHVARHSERPVALVDVTDGVTGTASGLEAACERLDVDLVVATDSGGDALAVGDEPGLRSPLADALFLVALESLSTESMLGVFGFGSDGELTVDELEAAVSRIARRDGLLGSWGLTPRTVEEMTDLLAVVPTEASRLPVEAAQGELGARSIRDGARTLRLTPASIDTFYFDPPAVIEGSKIAPLVRGTSTITEADEALAAAGYASEIRLDEGNPG